MIGPAAARDLVQRLKQIEDRLGRLLTSGWRQARTEAADLRGEADALAEAGLSQVAARVAAVAEAGSPAEALAASALAASACRLLRARLLADPAPDGWAPLAPPKRRSSTGTDTLLPVSRLLLDGREVWACLMAARNRCVLLEPPSPAEEAPDGGIFGRLTRRIGLAADQPVPPPSRWLNERLRGTLVWRARYPLGAEGDLPLCALDRPEWVAHDDEQQALQVFRQRLAGNTLDDGTVLSWQVGGFRVVALDRADPAAFVWLDPSGAELLAAARDTTVWSITWVDGGVVVPVAFLVPGCSGRPPRIVHLVPGAPSDILATQV